VLFIGRLIDLLFCVHGMFKLIKDGLDEIDGNMRARACVCV
jgi:hypothetical protein